MRRLWVGLLLLLMAACATSPAQPKSQHQPPAPQRTMPIDPTPIASQSPPPKPVQAAASRHAPVRFRGSVSKLPPDLRDRMDGTTWRPGCPVSLGHLVLLRMSYWDLDGNARRGPMVVNRAVGMKIVSVFRKLFHARFRIADMHLAVKYNPKNDDPHDDRSWTTGFNCRPAVTAFGPRANWSQHAYGLAIDVNTVQNPYVAASGYIHNIPSRTYRDRSQHLPGMIHPGDVVVRAFQSIGWHWGGYWSHDKDYMHFSWNGH